MAAPVGVERTEQALGLHHLPHTTQAGGRPFLINQEQGVDRAGGVIHRRHQIVKTLVAREPGVPRGVLMQHHADHRPTRTLLAMRRARTRRRHQTSPMQVQLGHRVAQHVVVPFAQLLVEMLYREATVEGAIQPQHALDLRLRGAPRRWTQPPVAQPCRTLIPVALSPTAERPLADPKPVPLPPPGSVQTAPTGQAHPQNASDESPRECVPAPSCAPSTEAHGSGHFTSYKHRTTHELATRAVSPLDKPAQPAHTPPASLDLSLLVPTALADIPAPASTRTLVTPPPVTERRRNGGKPAPTQNRSIRCRSPPSAAPRSFLNTPGPRPIPAAPKCRSPCFPSGSAT